jgi:hypothetical protein
MAVPSCEECKVIYQELVDLVRIAHQNKPGPDATTQQLVTWFDQRDEDEEYKLRVRPALSTLTRRWIEHQKLTGHIVPLPLPPGGLASPN